MANQLRRQYPRIAQYVEVTAAIQPTAIIYTFDRQNRAILSDADFSPRETARPRRPSGHAEAEIAITHTVAKVRGFSPTASGCTAPLEGAGFEPSVPRETERLLDGRSCRPPCARAKAGRRTRTYPVGTPVQQLLQAHSSASSTNGCP